MRIHRPGVRSYEVQMIPLIDTFFLLLAFFISSVLTMEVVRGLPVQLPQAQGSAVLVKEDRLLVSVGSEGMLQWEGESVTLEELSRRLRKQPQPHLLQIGIRADRDTPYVWLVQVLAVVQQAGIGKVALLTRPGVHDTVQPSGQRP